MKRARAVDDRKRQQLVTYGLHGIAILDVGLPSYAKDLVCANEVAVAFCDARPALCWLVEPEERWAPGPGVVDEHRQANIGHGLAAAHVAEQIGSAVAGLRVFASSYAHDTHWLRRLHTACGLEMKFEVEDLWLLARAFEKRGEQPPVDVEWAREWSTHAVISVERAVIAAGREAAFLRELSRRAHPE